MKNYFFDLLRYRVYLDLKSERAQSYLGFLWWFLEPAFYLVAFYLIFDVFLNRGGEGFVGFLLCGLVFWRWFDVSIKKSSVSILANAATINQVYVPKIIFPLVEIVIASYKFLFVLIALLIFLVLYKKGFSKHWLSLPFLLAIQITMMSSIGLIVSLVIPFVPDFRKVIDNIMMFMFYMSGVFFDISQVSAEAQKYLMLNPMATMLEQYRVILLYESWPNWESLAVIAVVSIGFLFVGIMLAKKLYSQYPRFVQG